MDEPVIILIASGISTVITLLGLYLVRKQAYETIELQASQSSMYFKDLLKDQGQAVINTINESLQAQLDPILKVNSQAMSIIGKAGAAANQMKMAERQIMEAVNEQLPISPDMIEEFSPALAETLRKYPELGPKALQVIQKLTGGGGDWGFNMPSSSNAAKYHSRPEE